MCVCAEREGACMQSAREGGPHMCCAHWSRNLTTPTRSAGEGVWSAGSYE